MSYPDYPKNRLVADGVDLTSQYGLILVDGYVLNPPEPKTYEVDIPGGDGKIDLTEALLGDTAYKNRKMEFEFYKLGLKDAEDFERFMTEIKRFLHGKSHDFKITMDYDYTYHGRFTISDIKHNMYSDGVAGYFKVAVDAEPYKYLDESVYRVDAVGVKTVYFENGRKRVRPTIETDGFLKIIYKNKLTTLPQGTWTINDVVFEEGSNEVYFNSYDIKNLTWGEIKEAGTTWSEFKKKRLYEWYTSSNDGIRVMKTWKDLESIPWNELSNKTWADFMYMANMTANVKDVYVKYKVGDL